MLAIAVSLVIHLAATTTYEVGPSAAYHTLCDAPIDSLTYGDTLLIDYQVTPYTDNFTIDGDLSGDHSSQPIVVQGVPGPNGELPILDGATSPGSCSKISQNSRGFVHVTANDVVVANLEIRNANSSNAYWGSAASSVYAESGARLTFTNLDIHGSNNGFFSYIMSSDIVVQGCYLHDNGINGDSLHHNNYTESNGITFQYNHFGPLLSGSLGTNLKDRSIGSVIIRYNEIDGGDRVLDLVEPQDYWQGLGSGGTDTAAQVAAALQPTFVYGNLLIKETAPSGQNQIVHFGGDDLDAPFRQTLFFYDNTVYSVRATTTVFFFNFSTATPDSGDPDPTLGNLPTADVRNNIFFTTGAGSSLAMIDSDPDAGVTMTQAGNWANQGWQAWSSGGDPGTGTTLSPNATFTTGSDPGFNNAVGGDFTLAATSPAHGIAQTLIASESANNAVDQQYVAQNQFEARPTATAAGAFEDCGGQCAITSGGGTSGGGTSGGGTSTTSGGGTASSNGGGAASSAGGGSAGPSNGSTSSGAGSATTGGQHLTGRCSHVDSPTALGTFLIIVAGIARRRWRRQRIGVFHPSQK